MQSAGHSTHAVYLSAQHNTRLWGQPLTKRADVACAPAAFLYHQGHAHLPCRHTWGRQSACLAAVGHNNKLSNSRVYPWTFAFWQWYNHIAVLSLAVWAGPWCLLVIRRSSAGYFCMQPSDTGLS